MITNLWDLATLERPSRLPCERSMPPVCWFGKIISTLFLKNKNHEKLQRPTYVSSNVNVWHFSMQLLTFNSFAFAPKCIDISLVGTCFCWVCYFLWHLFSIYLFKFIDIYIASTCICWVCYFSSLHFPVSWLLLVCKGSSAMHDIGLQDSK